MMPSACTKPDQKASSEASDPMTKVINVVEKKVRNLEKRKGKLDGYREKLDSGQGLNEDQRDAITKYDGVVQNLEFARDLQKQFLSINAETEKLSRRQLKRDKLERQSQDVSRVRELLQLQGLLDNMGSDTVRSDFLTGSQGAVVLTEDNLNQLDELYKLISPTRDGETSYVEQLNAASEHLTFFLDMKDKEVIGTTYKDLHEMVIQIHQCGYFDRLSAEDKKEAETTTAVSDEAAAAAEEEEEEEEAEDEQQPEPEFASHEISTSVSETISAEMSQLPAELSHPQHPAQDQQTVTHTTMSLQQAPDTSCTLSQEEEEAVAAQQQALQEQESYFSTASNFPRQRPVQEILSSVQGTYDFLQESHVDLDSPAHLDPAVVAAHPMAPTMTQQNSDGSLTVHGYQSNLLATEDQTSQYQTSASQYQTSQYQTSSAHVTQPSPVEQTLQAEQSKLQSDTQYSDHVSSQHDSQTSSYVAQQSALESTYTTESYGQNLMGSSLQSTAQHSYSDQTSSLANQISSHSIEQSLAMSSADSSGPQPIPLPSQVMPGQSLTRQTYSGAADSSAAYDTSQGYSSATDSSQSYVSATDNSQTSRASSDSEEKKQPFLNPNADMFRPAAGYSSQQPEVSMAQQDGNYSQGGAINSGGQEEPKTYNQAAAGSFQSDFQSGGNFPALEGSSGFRGSGYGGNSRNSRNDMSNTTRTGSGSRETGSSAPRSGRSAAHGSGISNNNGYQRTGRGGAPYTSGGGNRGGYNNGNRGGGGSGGSGGGNRSTYQGYPARADYRPDGYQGYGNSNNFPAGFTKNTRGGASSGAPRGNSRGGAAGAGMRTGGPPRNNNMRGNTAGSGSGGYNNRSGYGRPGSAGSAMPHAAS